MNERVRADARRNKRDFHVRETAGAATPSTVDELADLRDRSTISDEESRHAKAKVLGMEPGSAALAPVDDRAAPSPT
jgi:hypothetical protein